MQSRGRYFEDFKVGEALTTGRRTVEGGEVSRFAGLTGDFNPLHTDEVFARETPFGARVAHDILTLAISNGQQNLSGWFEGTAFALLGLDRVKFTAPGEVRRHDSHRDDRDAGPRVVEARSRCRLVRGGGEESA